MPLSLWRMQHSKTLQTCSKPSSTTALPISCRFLRPRQRSYAAFQNPASMQQAIIDYCATHQLQVPQTKAEIVRCVLQSLAAKYAEATAHLNEMLPQPIKCMHIIGGGSQNKLLNRLTSEALGVPVIAGPIEATGMGNILTQALAKGEIKDIDELRAVVRQSI